VDGSGRGLVFAWLSERHGSGALQRWPRGEGFLSGCGLSELMPCGGGHATSMTCHVAVVQVVYKVRWDGLVPRQRTRGRWQQHRSGEHYRRQLCGSGEHCRRHASAGGSREVNGARIGLAWRSVGRIHMARGPSKQSWGAAGLRKRGGDADDRAPYGCEREGASGLPTRGMWPYAGRG
jgi:hypothetical protein